jgi:hypothetical protein
MANKAEVADVRFKVCERGDGTPYLCPLEGGPKTNSVLNDKNLLSLHLRPGVTFDQAQKFARLLNEHVNKIGITFVD